jgi:hypothetical protein
MKTMTVKMLSAGTVVGEQEWPWMHSPQEFADHLAGVKPAWKGGVDEIRVWDGPNGVGDPDGVAYVSPAAEVGP